MKFIYLTLFVLFQNTYLDAQKSVYSFIETKPIYLYTDADFFDVFEVSVMGSESLKKINDNAKIKLLTELINNGNTEKKIIKPLISKSTPQSFLSARNENILKQIINDTSCINAQINSIIKPLILSSRKTYKKTFIVRVNLINIKKQLINFE